MPAPAGGVGVSPQTQAGNRFLKRGDSLTFLDFAASLFTGTLLSL